MMVNERIQKILIDRNVEGELGNYIFWSNQFMQDVFKLYSFSYIEKLSDEALWAVYCMWVDSMPEDFDSHESRVASLIEHHNRKIGYIAEPEFKKEGNVLFLVGGKKTEMNYVAVYEKILKENSFLNSDLAIDYELVYSFVAETAYWHSHPCGYPVNAPKHADRISESFKGLGVEFGANTFEAQYCFTIAVLMLRNYFSELVKKNKKADSNYVKTLVETAATSSISNYSGALFESYPNTNGYMVLGAQAICVDSVIKFVLERTGVRWAITLTD